MVARKFLKSLICSFYKEDLAGETITYVQIRAKTSQKHPKRVLVEMVEEMGDIHRRVQATLAGYPDALKSWKTLEYGIMYVPGSSSHVATNTISQWMAFHG